MFHDALVSFAERRAIFMKNQKSTGNVCPISVMAAFAGAEGRGRKHSQRESERDPAWKGSHDHALWEISETVNHTLGKTVTNFDVLDGTKYEGDDDENNAWTSYLKEKLNVLEHETCSRRMRG